MRKKPRILMIDNDLYYCMVMRVALEANNFSTVFYENNASATMPATLEIQPDIILLDIVLHKKGGLQVLDELKNNGATAHIPIIVLTALCSDDARVETSRHFSEYYMEKSGNTNELKMKIQKLLALRGIEVDLKTKNDQAAARPPSETSKGYIDKEIKTAVPIEDKEEAWRGKKILVISEEPASLVGLDSFFSTSGFDFCFCNDPARVLDTFETERPDVVIVDIALKKIEGSDIVSRVNGSKIKTKIIVITSIGEAPVVRDLVEHGADDILVKPYSIEQLYAMIIKNLMS